MRCLSPPPLPSPCASMSILYCNAAYKKYQNWDFILDCRRESIFERFVARGSSRSPVSSRNVRE
jgi:hypothetical protein